MNYTTLPNTELKVSKICLGTMTFGNQNTESESHSQLDYALEKGINFIDTAEMYPIGGNAQIFGSTERHIGTWIKKIGASEREKLVLATKIAGPNRGMEYIRQPLDFSKKSIHEAVELSLENLQTDYLDLLLLHRPSPLMNPREIAETFDELREQKKVRHFGVSNFSVSQFELINDAFPLVTNQVEISINHTDAFYNGTLDQMLLKKLRPMAWSVMGNYFTQPCAQNARIKKFLMNFVQNMELKKTIFFWLFCSYILPKFSL